MKQAERPVLHRWTRHEYERLIDHGLLDEDDPIELLDGLLLVKEPQHSPHRTAVLLVAKALERAFGEGWFVQTQSPSFWMTDPSPSRMHVSFGARRVTIPAPNPLGRRSSSRSRSCACVLPVE